MLRNYLKAAFRNLLKNKTHSIINITGLSVGMAIAILIGLWIWDELSFNKYHKNYDHIAQLKQNQVFNGATDTWNSMPYPMGNELRNKYGDYFKHVVMSSWTENHILTSGDKQLMKDGNYVEQDAPEMFSFDMLQGTRASLKDPYSIILSQSLAETLFGNADPLEQLIKLDGKVSLKVTGVFKDLPYNSVWGRVSYFMPWKLKAIVDGWVGNYEDTWGSNGFQVFVQIADHVTMEQVSAKIRNTRYDNLDAHGQQFKPQVFLHPMSKWRLYEQFKNGVNTGGRIEFVWLFGIIGVFVLLLACINFMNLSTARSEKRAKEVGIRKAVGSLRGQLMIQFFSESVLMAMLAFICALLLAQLLLPVFNEMADKKISLLWQQPWFWLLGVGFALLTGIISGSYPAMYLSAFQPVKVLKGTFRAGRLAAVPRKVLVVLQFTVSVTLIIGTLVVFRQVQYAKNRPVGYNREGLIAIHMVTPVIYQHFDAVRDELKKAGAITEMASSEAPLTEVWSTNGGFDWVGKDPALAVDFPNTGVSYDYGKTVGWQFKEGRDFSRDFASDSIAFVVNESAVKFMGLKDPVGQTLKWEGIPFKIIGVIKDVVTESPYARVRASVYCMARGHDNFMILRINPALSTHTALAKIEATFKRYNPAQPFTYAFADDSYALKFNNEERIGKLASSFAILAIFISCLGLFGMASFMAEQRTKEIGVRKVLGASVLNLWGLLSKDFLLLVVISLVVATPLAYYFMHQWLQNYEYRSGIAWWIFALTGAGALLITLLTVSYQSIKAALMNPVKSLRTE